VSSTFLKLRQLSSSEPLFVLSYRWAHTIDVTCTVTAPGGKPSVPRACVLPVDAFRALKQLERGFMWIDFLSHLHDPQHIPHTLNNMGRLYCEAEVWPLYLADFCANSSADSGAGATTSTLEALRRGWIQQEVSFGTLNQGVVAAFATKCVSTGCFGLLGTLIRRRPTAMAWMMQNCVLDFELQSKLARETNYYTDTFGPTKSVALQPNHTDLMDEGDSSPQLTRIAAEAMLEVANNESPEQGESSNVNAAVRCWVSKDPSHVEQLVLELCKPQRCDPTEPFAAFQLLRAFSESAIKCEGDAYCAMAQCATESAPNLLWSPEDPGAILRVCWVTIVDYVLQHGSAFRFAMRRKDPAHWTAGLGKIARLEEPLGVFPHCDQLDIS
jgi:hypothetical protein